MTPATNSVKPECGELHDYLNSTEQCSSIECHRLSVTGLPLRTSSTFQMSSITPGLNPATDTFVILTTQADPFLAKQHWRS